MRLFEGKILKFRNDPTDTLFEFHSYGENGKVLISEMDAKRYDLLWVDLSMLTDIIY